MIDNLLKYSNEKENSLDMGICSSCGWEGKLSDCETEMEGDWETGYYAVALCPKCPDGGCIDDYYSSEDEQNDQ